MLADRRDIFCRKVKYFKIRRKPCPSGTRTDSSYSLHRILRLRFSQRCIWRRWQLFAGRHIQTSKNIRPQLGSHEILRGRNLHHILSQCWRWLCTIRYRRASVSQWLSAYSVRVEEATFISRLNINFCRSLTVTNIKRQKGETDYVGEVTMDNLTRNRLQAVPPVYCFLLSQCIILSVTEISLTFCTRNMTDYGSGMKRGLSEPWWS